jgi:threonine synthase
MKCKLFTLMDIASKSSCVVLLTRRVLQPYNFERIVFYATGCNCDLIREWMTVMERTQKLTLETKWHDRLKEDFCSARVTDDEMIDTLCRVYTKLNYVADPHSAVAMAAAIKVGYTFTEIASAKETMPVVILATASPCKFREQMTVALGLDGWESWKAQSFPVRAHKTLETKEIEPYYFPKTEGASLSEVQSKWRGMMLDIVDDHF